MILKQVDLPAPKGSINLISRAVKEAILGRLRLPFVLYVSARSLA
jgi:hypothetical protein